MGAEFFSDPSSFLAEDVLLFPLGRDFFFRDYNQVETGISPDFFGIGRAAFPYEGFRDFADGNKS